MGIETFLQNLWNVINGKGSSSYEIVTQGMRGISTGLGDDQCEDVKLTLQLTSV